MAAERTLLFVGVLLVLLAANASAARSKRRSLLSIMMEEVPANASAGAAANATAAVGDEVLMSGWLNFSSSSSAGEWVPNSLGNATKGPNKLAHFFRLNKYSLWYTESEDALDQVMGAISVRHIDSVNDGDPTNKNGTVFRVGGSREGDAWTISTASADDKTKWMCTIKGLIGSPCTPNAADAQPVLEQRQIIVQPIMLVPGSGPDCTTRWNYRSQGDDWGCDCNSGQEQSPIDLPAWPDCKIEKTALQFRYNRVVKVGSDGKPLKIKFDGHVISIKADFGSLIGPDLTVYDAKMITFHTPSEHKLNGIAYEMEMQIHHEADEENPLDNPAILSVFFRKKPGAHNKFMDQLDPMNFPFVPDETVDVIEKLNLANLFVDNPDTQDVPSKSYYHYMGSMTTPPCEEQKKWFVLADPIDLSVSHIAMASLAGSKALEFGDEPLARGTPASNKIKIDLALSGPGNNRKTMPLNNRTIWYYPAPAGCAPSVTATPQQPAAPMGHWEKRVKPVTDYIFVDDLKPSGIPGAISVPDQEVPQSVRDSRLPTPEELRVRMRTMDQQKAYQQASSVNIPVPGGTPTVNPV